MKIFIPAVMLLLAGCQTTGAMSTHPQAICRLQSVGKGMVSGKVYFTQETEAILIEAEIDGLTPGKHGIHIHENGDCGGAAGEAAGGHFNPLKGAHGAPGVAESHEGDLGNIVADAKGRARLLIRDKRLSLVGENGLMGRSVVVHASEDDLASQPAGNSGGRVACGTISAAKY